LATAVFGGGLAISRQVSAHHPSTTIDAAGSGAETLKKWGELSHETC